MSFRIESRHIGLLAAGVLVLGGAWLATSSAEAKIRREEQLIYSGTEIRDAIASYYFAASPGKRELPRDMHDLIDDTRDGTHRRHLSRLVKDPVTGSDDWVVVWTPDHRMAGVHSASEDSPVGRHDFDRDAVQVGGTRHYSQWVFRFDPGTFGPADEALGAPAGPRSRGTLDTLKNRGADESAPVPRLASSKRLSHGGGAKHSGSGARAEANDPVKLRIDSLHRLVRSDRGPRLAMSTTVRGPSAGGGAGYGVAAGDHSVARAHSAGTEDARSGPSAYRSPVRTVPARTPHDIEIASHAAPSPRGEPPFEAGVASPDIGNRRAEATANDADNTSGPAGGAAAADGRREAPVALKLAIPEWLLPARLEPYGSVAVAPQVHGGTVSGATGSSAAGAERAALAAPDPRASASNSPSSVPASPEFVGTALVTSQPSAPVQKVAPQDSARGAAGAGIAEAMPEGSSPAEPAMRMVPFGSDATSGDPVPASRPVRGRIQARAVGTGASAGVMPGPGQAAGESLPAPGGTSAVAGDGGPTAEEIAQARQVACDLLSTSDQELCARAAAEGNGAAASDCLRAASDRFDRCTRGEPPSGIAAQ